MGPPLIQHADLIEKWTDRKKLARQMLIDTQSADRQLGVSRP